MLCYVMLCYVMLCYVMLCYVMLCYVMLCYVMLCYVMLCYVMLCYVMLCYVMLCYVMLCYVMLCYVMLLPYCCTQCMLLPNEQESFIYARTSHCSGLNIHFNSSGLEFWRLKHGLISKLLFGASACYQIEIFPKVLGIVVVLLVVLVVVLHFIVVLVLVLPVTWLNIILRPTLQCSVWIKSVGRSVGRRRRCCCCCRCCFCCFVVFVDTAAVPVAAAVVEIIEKSQLMGISCLRWNASKFD